MPPVFLSLQTMHVPQVEAYELSAEQSAAAWCQGTMQGTCFVEMSLGDAVLCGLEHVYSLLCLIIAGSCYQSKLQN